MLLVVNDNGLGGAVFWRFPDTVLSNLFVEAFEKTPDSVPVRLVSMNDELASEPSLLDDASEDSMS